LSAKGRDEDMRKVGREKG
jgi:hypothetical protein